MDKSQNLSFELWSGNACYEEVGPGGDWDAEKVIAFAKEAMELWVRDAMKGGPMMQYGITIKFRFDKE